MELEMDEEKRRHAETIKILRKKERQLKEVMIQCEEDQKNIVLLQDSLEKTTQKVNIYKRQLTEQVWISLKISYTLSFEPYYVFIKTSNTYNTVKYDNDLSAKISTK